MSWRDRLAEALSGDDAPTVEELVKWMKEQPARGKAHRLLDEFVTKWNASRNGSEQKTHSASRWLPDEDAVVQRTEPAVEAAVEWLCANFTPVGKKLYDAAGKRVQLKAVYPEIKKRFDIDETWARKKCVKPFREWHAERMKAFSVGLIPRPE